MCQKLKIIQKIELNLKENNNENTISSELENGIVIGPFLISIHRIMDQ